MAVVGSCHSKRQQMKDACGSHLFNQLSWLCARAPLAVAATPPNYQHSFVSGFVLLVGPCIFPDFVAGTPACSRCACGTQGP